MPPPQNRLVASNVLRWSVSVIAVFTVTTPALARGFTAPSGAGGGGGTAIGREVSIPRHLQDGEEFLLSTRDLVEHGRKLFIANWTIQEGGGRPLTKGTGNPLSDPTARLEFPRNFNRISAPDANSCAGCHNAPFGIAGGGGDFVANVFVLGQRFDFSTFDHSDTTPTRGAVDELGLFVEQQTVANNRNTLGMFGSGYIEMLARQMTVDLQAQRDRCQPGESMPLSSKGISFGSISRDPSGAWITTAVEGLVGPSLATTGPSNPPSLVLRPFHQASNVVSLRQFTNNAMNHHHGIQTTERFGTGTDPDDDGFADEMTRADVTAISVFQAGMAVPGRVIPRDAEIEDAVHTGEARFMSIGCGTCHVPSLLLEDEGWIYTEPSPFNPPGNLRPGDAPTLSVDLTSDELPQPRLRRKGNTVRVPAFTDLKVHDITSGAGDAEREPLNMNSPPGSPGFFAGNGRFITRKLWGVANEPPYFHHGQFTTLRQAVHEHAGEAQAARDAFLALPSFEQDCVIEFLKTLQVLPPGTRHLVVDERGHPRNWNPAF